MLLGWLWPPGSRPFARILCPCSGPRWRARRCSVLFSWNGSPSRLPAGALELLPWRPPCPIAGPLSRFPYGAFAAATAGQLPCLRLLLVLSGRSWRPTHRRHPVEPAVLAAPADDRSSTISRQPPPRCTALQSEGSPAASALRTSLRKISTAGAPALPALLAPTRCGKATLQPDLRPSIPHRGASPDLGERDITRLPPPPSGGEWCFRATRSIPT